MGAYRYCSHPCNVARALIERDGKRETVEIALFRYAYKPYLWGQFGDRENRRMHLTSGAAKAAAAWTRARAQGRAMPKYGATFDAKERRVYRDSLFLTCGHATHLDDYRRYDGARLVEWLELPAGMTVMEGA